MDSNDAFCNCTTMEPRVNVFLFNRSAFLCRATSCPSSASVRAAFSSPFTSVTCRESNSLHFNPVQCLGGHILTLVNYFVYYVLIPVSCIVYYYCSTFIHFCSIFVFIRFFCSFFNYSEENAQFNPGLYSRYFDPVIQQSSLSLKSINIIHQTAPSLS
jgi:hypothetical protein